MSEIAREYLTVDNLPLATKQKRITKMLRSGLSARTVINDVTGLIRAMR